MSGLFCPLNTFFLKVLLIKKASMNRIHWNKMWSVMGNRDKDGEPIPFSITYIKKSTGEIRQYNHCTLSSLHTKGSTLNIMIPGEDKPKTIRKCLIKVFNGLTVYI